MIKEEKIICDKLARAELLISIDPASYEGIILKAEMVKKIEEMKIKKARKILFNL